MKFKNPKTGHEANDVYEANCPEATLCKECPAYKTAKDSKCLTCVGCAEESQDNLIKIMAALGYYPVETFRERLEREHPECTGEHFAGGCKGCPEDYGYEDKHEGCDVMTCVGCWDRIIPMKEYEEEKKMEKIKSGDIVRLKKEVIEAGTSVYNGVPISAGTIDALREKEFSVTTAWIDDAWSVKEGPLVCFIGEDALELVRHADDAEADDEPEEETEEKKMGIKEGDIVRLKKKVVEAGGGMYNDLTVTLGMVKALDGKKFEVCATGTDETWCIKTDGIMDGFIIGEDALELVKEETEEKGMEEPKIKDSGERRVFETGSVRDIQEGKGRCDLMPLDVVGCFDPDRVIINVGKFKAERSVGYLNCALREFAKIRYNGDAYAMWLEVSKHFEDGAKKYGENNWQKGIPVHCYIDSAVRHYLKYRAGWKDEPHDRAFVWNLMCCIWTMQHMPELDDYTEGAKDE